MFRGSASPRLPARDIYIPILCGSDSGIGLTVFLSTSAVSSVSLTLS